MSTQPLYTTQIDQLPVSVYATNEALGAAAADEAAEVIRAAVTTHGVANIIVATATRRSPPGRAPRPARRAVGGGRCLPHGRYVNLPAGHPASFPAFLRRHLLDYVQVKEFFPVPGVAGDTEAACRQYEALLRAHPADLCACGIGENGHLAFNDPPYADFDDPVWVKPVTLDERSRRQQVGEGHFGSLDEAPTHAITLTIPALLSTRPRPVHRTRGAQSRCGDAVTRGPITEDCPGSILRQTPHTHLFLDSESAAGL